MNTLTDRYVDATLRRLPGRQRPDIERELRTSIADAVDDRVDSGADPVAAERAVLTELGDPVRLAAGYADRPLHLIGPSLYLDYTRLLTALLVTVVPAVAATVGFLGAIEGGAGLPVVGDTLGAAVTTSIHIAFWTTLVFAVIERAPARHTTRARTWTPADLPEPPSRRARFGELIGATVMVVLLTAFVLFSPIVSTEHDANGHPIGLLSPWLWDTGVVYLFLALAVAGLGVTFAKHYTRWNPPLAVASALLNVATAGLLVWLATSDRLLNPAFTDAAAWPATVSRWVDIGLVVAAVITVAYAVIETAAGFATRSWVMADMGRLIRTATDDLTRTFRR